MKASVNWVDGAMLVAEAGSGHALVIDGPPEIGGRNLGPRPMEMMLLSVAGCSAMDVIHILRKSRQPFTDVRVEVSGERAETEPKVFTDIHLHFIVCGEGVKEAQVKRAVALSAEKYCSASIMLGASANITHDYEIRTPGD